ncbi:hypothetical protein ACQCN2_19285 [Brevibacillus ginsengisoli]|uniref:hypothetical protein n=1 Tax=Brevibacillus ginsengisoli TaxID=363854 RepID=UPI003CF53160
MRSVFNMKKAISQILLASVVGFCVPQVPIYALDGESQNTVSHSTFNGIITKEVVYDSKTKTYSFKLLSDQGASVILSAAKKNFRIPKIQKKDGKEIVTYGIPTHSQILQLFKPDINKAKLSFVNIELNDKGAVTKVTLLDTRAAEGASQTLIGQEWDKAADEDDNILHVGKNSYDVTDKTVVFDMRGNVSDGTRDELEDAKLGSFKELADDQDLTVHYILDKNGKEVAYLFVTSGDGVTSTLDYGTVQKFSLRNGSFYITLLNDGNQKEYKLDHTLNEGNEIMARGDFIGFSVNADQELVLSSVVNIINTHDMDPEKVEILNKNSLSNANLDSILTAQISSINGVNQIKYGGKLYYTSGNTHFFNMNGEKLSFADLHEGDYVVLIDTDDDGTRIDYVLDVISEDKAKAAHYDMTNFLHQGEK